MLCTLAEAFTILYTQYHIQKGNQPLLKQPLLGWLGRWGQAGTAETGGGGEAATVETAEMGRACAVL